MTTAERVWAAGSVLLSIGGRALGTAADTLASQLSRKFACPALAILVHDDDVFWYRLYADGELADEYSSNPEYFSGDRSGNSSGWAGDAGQLCQTFQCPDQTAEVKRILAAPRRDRDTLATRRHQDLVQAIGLPAWSVSTGFQDLAARAALPDGFLDTLGATVSSQN